MRYLTDCEATISWMGIFSMIIIFTCGEGSLKFMFLIPLIISLSICIPAIFAGKICRKKKRRKT